MGIILGALGAGASYASGRGKEKKYRHHLNRLREDREKATKYLEERQASLEGDPLMSALMKIYMGELASGPSAESRSGLWDQLSGGASALLDPTQALGLGDPKVQQDIINASIENKLVPGYQAARERQEADFAARGIGRSGLAESAASERDYTFAKGAADIERTVRTEGALQELKDRLSKLGAVSGIYGQGEQVAGAQRGQAGQFGIGMQGLLGQLAQALAGTQMQHAGFLAGTGPSPTRWQDTAQGLFQWAGMNNANPYYQQGAKTSGAYDRWQLGMPGSSY